MFTRVNTEVGLLTFTNINNWFTGLERKIPKDPQSSKKVNILRSY